MQLFTWPWKPRTVLLPLSEGLKCVSLRAQVIPDSLPAMQRMERLPGCLSSPAAATTPQMLTAKALGAGQERAGPQDSARLAVEVSVITTTGS